MSANTLEGQRELLPIGIQLTIIRVNRSNNGKAHYFVLKVTDGRIDDVTALAAKILNVRRNDKTGGIPFRGGHDLGEEISFRLYGYDNVGVTEETRQKALDTPTPEHYIAGFTFWLKVI